MLKVRIRPTSALASLMAALLILALPAGAFAQLTDVADAPIAFWNATDKDVSIEGISVLRRNGQEVPAKAFWTFKPGQYSWLELNQQKFSGVTFTFVVRTDGQASAWTMHSSGPGQDGYFRVDFTKDHWQSHLQTPALLGNVTPAIPTAAERHRQFLQQQVARVQAAITQDEDLIARLNVGGELFKGVGTAIGDEGKRRENLKDGILGAIANGLGQAMANRSAQDIAAARARVQANRELLNRYGRELNPPPAVNGPAF